MLERFWKQVKNMWEVVFISYSKQWHDKRWNISKIQTKATCLIIIYKTLQNRVKRRNIRGSSSSVDWFVSWKSKEEIGSEKLRLGGEIIVRINMLQPIVLRNLNRIGLTVKIKQKISKNGKDKIDWVRE